MGGNIQDMQDANLRMKERIMRSEMVQSGTPVTSSTMARFLNKSVSRAADYLKQLEKDRRLSSTVINNRRVYSKTAGNILSTSWRINEEIYEELERELEEMC